MLSLVQRPRGRHPQLTACKLFKNLNSSTTGSSSPISQSHAKHNIHATNQQSSLPNRETPHHLTQSQTATNKHPLPDLHLPLHRDNPNARFIKNELRSLHLAPLSSSQYTAARLKAFTAECDAFNGGLLEIAVDLKGIGKDIQEEIATADSWSGILNVTEGLKDVGKDLDDLKKDVRAVRDDMMDLTELIDRHCCKGRVVIYG